MADRGNGGAQINTKYLKQSFLFDNSNTVTQLRKLKIELLCQKGQKPIYLSINQTAIGKSFGLKKLFIKFAQKNLFF